MKVIRNITLILALAVLTFGIGFQLGSKRQQTVISLTKDIENKTSDKYTKYDFSLFWNVWDRLNYSYIDKKVMDPQKMIYGAISGMVSSLGDPYTVFLPPEQNSQAKEDLGGKFEGIGAQLGVKDKKIVVIAPLKSSPAEKSGIRAGDWIVKVDGKDTINWTLPEAVSKIRGQKGSKVVLTIIRKDAEKREDITVLRDEIKVPSVEWEVKKEQCDKQSFSSCPQVVYLKLGRFGDRTNDEWSKTVEAISKQIKSNKNIKGLVFDLRNNPGGYLSGSVFIASEFLDRGPIVIQENADGTKKTSVVERQGKLTNIPLVVLINKGSASASEIVAGSLKVRRGVKLVGETSFGKGTIQEAQDLPEGAGIHITTAKWLLPDNSWINGSGLKPDVEIENDETKPDEDLQLNKAIETLLMSL